MPEGPSIILLKEEVVQYSGKKSGVFSGNSNIKQDRLLNKKIMSFKGWGKHFLICFKNYTLCVHFLIYGTYRINETKDKPIRLNLAFSNGEINFIPAR